MSGRIGGGGGRWRWLKKGMTPCTGVNRCTMLSLSISFFLFLFFSPSILSLSLSRYSLVIDRTLMRFVIGVCTDCTPSYERTLPPNTHTRTPWFCTRASTCLEEDFGLRRYLWSDMGQR